MKYIFKIFIILIITLSSSACFDNLYNLQISHVQAPDADGLSEDPPTCSYSDVDIAGGSIVAFTEGIMDLEYIKAKHKLTKMYGYMLRLAVFNISSQKSEDNINTIHIRKATVKTYSDRNELLNNQEEIITDVTITPQGAVSLPIRIFNNINDWEGDESNPDDSTAFLYTPFIDYNTQDLSTKHVIIDVVLSGETLSGVEVTSDHFRFRINLCIGCLYQENICPIGSTEITVCSTQDFPIYCKSDED